MASEHFDLLIVGGGPIGALAALLAAQRDLSVLLIDAADEAAAPQADAPVDLRVVAVSPGSRQLIESVAAWPSALASRIQPYRGMQVWDGSGPGRIQFAAQDQGLPRLGDIIEVPVLQWGLDQALRRTGVQRWCATRLQDLQYHADVIELHCSDGRQARAPLVLGADGRDSMLRRRAGIDLEQRDYQQAGVVAVLRLTQPHQAVARQVFTAEGPLGLLPLPGDAVSIVWSLPQAQAERQLACDEQHFIRSLSEVSGIGFEALLSPRVSFPLGLQHACEYVSDGLALAGDAAHVVHPLAGLGMNLGFEDVAALQRHAFVRKRLHSPRALAAALSGYQRERRREVALAMATIDGLERLFASRSGELIRVRDAGLNLVDQLSPVKRLLMRQALGADVAAAAVAG